MSKHEDFALATRLEPAQDQRPATPGTQPKLDQLMLHERKLAERGRQPVLRAGKAPGKSASARRDLPATQPIVETPIGSRAPKPPAARKTETAPRSSPARERSVEIPRPTVPQQATPAGHRICPSGTTHGMVRQTIANATCEERQCSGYHKCAGCSFQQRSPGTGGVLPALENGPSALSRERHA